MDRLIRTITSDGAFMASAIDSTEAVILSQELHNLTRTTSAVLGRAITGTALMAARLKNTDAVVTVQIRGDGPVGNVVAISDSLGHVRGYVDNPSLDLPLRSDGKIDVGGAVGHYGRFGVIRDNGAGEPYTGQIELVSGEIAEDFTSYYATSEQIPTVCALGVLCDKGSSNVILAGGLLIQALPGALDSDLDKLEANLAKMDSMTTMLAKGMTLEEIVNTALDGFEVEKLDETDIHYACTCSKEKYAKALITLGADELKDLPKVNGLVEAVCPYCNKHYYFYDEDIEQLILSAQK